MYEVQDYPQQTQYLYRCNVVARYIADLSHSILSLEPVLVKLVNDRELITRSEREIIWQHTLVFVQCSIHSGLFVFFF